MPVFATLSERLNHIFSKLTKRGKLDELEIKTAMREVRVALLEADVNVQVAKEFCARCSEKALGQEILKSLNPGQQVIKVVNDELIALMGSSNSKIEFASKPPTVIMLCGLQGAGKTTLCGKLGAYLKKNGHKPLAVACDIYRPAAINQLRVVCEKVGMDLFEKGTQNPVRTAGEAVKYAQRQLYDTVILDTAGRLEIDDVLMKELEKMKREVSPTEILLVVDSMIGQSAVNVAKTFDERLGLTGVVLTKLDGDTRGGACLSVKAVTGKPIKFISSGEKMEDLEPFYPDRMASRILGMGDVLTLIEKAEEAVSDEEAKAMTKKMYENSFTLEDYLEQFEYMKKMGGAQALVSMMPGMPGGKRLSVDESDEKRLERQKAMLLSMTPQERRNPQIINGSRRRRIAAGSGTTVQEVNQLMKQYEQTKAMMKQFKNGGKGAGRRGRMPFQGF